MDLVDIDQVLDNLELHEEAANELRKKIEQTAKQQEQKEVMQKSTANGFVSQSKESGFRAVSQVFNSLDEYCKNVESLETKVTSVSSLNEQFTSQQDLNEKSGFQPSQLVAASRQELEEYEHEVEESNDIHKFTEKPRNRHRLASGLVDKDSTDSTNSQSSESLTTSSNSTFSSGPSLEAEDSLEEPTPLTNSKENVMVEENENSAKTGSDQCIENQEPLSDNDKLLEISETSTNNSENLAQSLLVKDTEAMSQKDKDISICSDEQIQQNLPSPNVEDLTHGLSTISLTSANLQSQSILPLETSLSSSLGHVLQNLTDSNNTSALSQTRDTSIAHHTTHDINSEAANTSVEVLNEQPTVPDAQQQLPQVPQIYDYNQAKYDDANSAGIQQPVTFCSTMDEISDAELDSMLQEMDIDDEAVIEQPSSNIVEELREEHVEILDSLPQTTATLEKTDTICTEQSDEVLSNASSGDHPNGDSFSQASTVEFSEIRPQNQQELPECEDNMVINSAVSSYSNSESSSLEGDIIHPKNVDSEDADPDPSRPQRPTSLDLPAIQALDMYANAGQTPPGTEQTEHQENPVEVQTPSPDVEPEVSHVANDIAEATGYSEDPHANLGKIPPIWVPDNMATGCMQCSAKFTMIKRRHHCRACGKVLCSVCCSQKFKLEFLTDPESRVCVQCYLILTQRQSSQPNSAAGANINTSNIARSPNPNNPMEYCSTVPPYRQVSTEPKTPPSVIVPVGVLKKDNGSFSSTSSNSSGQKARKRKSVMFSDGIAPGSDLANIDQWNEPKQARRQSDRSSRSANNNKPATPRSEYITDASTMGLVAQLFRGSIPPIAAAATVNTVQQTSASTTAPKTNELKAGNNSSDALGSTGKTVPENSRPKRLPPSGCDDQGCFIPETEGSLPPIVVAKDETGCDFDYRDVANNYELIKRLQNETLKFAVQKNFFVFVKIVNLKCCLNRTVINFTTSGMHHVGNDEIVILLEFEPPASKEGATGVAGTLIPRDIFVHLNEIYNDAEAGKPIQELSHTKPLQDTFLGSRDYGGFIFIRPSFQCMLDVIQPDKPYLIGILIHRYEIPWAKVFPLRLMLRLGAQYRYYPCPHVSMCNRESVYAEIAQTIINFLADFRNYTYTLPFIRGMYIHMEDRQTTVVIPRNRLDDVVKAINNSSDHILAFGGNFSKTADGHLVCMQNVNDDRTEMYAYSTQAINIQGQPRKVTGASFFVLNESLKASSGLSGKCSIVEDGLMVQILPAKMVEVRESLKNQKDITIICGPIDADEQHTEIVCLKWVDNDKEFNIGVKSPIDERLMDGVSSMRVHARFNYSNSNFAIRLTDIYVIKYEDWYNTNSSTLNATTTTDVTRMTEQIARSTSMALLPFLDLLAASKSTKIGLRATLHQDNVCYEAGARGSKLPPLYMNALDNHLIPTLHGISSGIEEAIILELIFYILNV